MGEREALAILVRLHAFRGRCKMRCGMNKAWPPPLGRTSRSRKEETVTSLSEALGPIGSQVVRLSDAFPSIVTPEAKHGRADDDASPRKSAESQKGRRGKAWRNKLDAVLIEGRREVDKATTDHGV